MGDTKFIRKSRATMVGRQTFEGLNCCSKFKCTYDSRTADNYGHILQCSECVSIKLSNEDSNEIMNEKHECLRTFFFILSRTS